MRQWIISIALGLAACSGAKNKTSPEQVTAKSVAAAPTVAVATVLATVEGVPPYLVLLDEAGQARVGAAASWAELDANQLTVTRRAMSLAHADRYMRDDFGLGKPPMDTIATLDESGDGGGASDLAVLEGVAPPWDLAGDDPPPPEEEGIDDGDLGGGTGTAMALEDGKMGRAAGHEAQRSHTGPQLGRHQAIEAARNAGILGPSTEAAPLRIAAIEGAVMEDGKLDQLRGMVCIAPTAKATKLIDAVYQTDMAIAVLHAGKLRPLRLQFGERYATGSDSDFWLEARVSAKRVVIEAVPDVPIELAALDPKELAAALAKARSTRGADAGAPVDVLVDADVDAQRLIDVVVALDTAGVRMLGMGPAPSREQLGRRGKRIPRVVAGRPTAMGDLDKALIRRVVGSSDDKLKGCYEKALLVQPQLAGAMMVELTISSKGKVVSSAATGVDPALARCIADVIKTLEFPKPNDGGSVQVSYPFTLRP